MKKQGWLFIFGAVLLLGAAPVFSAAARPGPPQTSSSKTRKKGASSRSRRRSRVKGQTAPTTDRIKEIQSALQRDGAYEGTPTGKWDAATADALKKFQDKNGLSPTGKIDALTIEKLGLGAETAGKGAPVPAASTAAPPADPPAK